MAEFLKVDVKIDKALAKFNRLKNLIIKEGNASVKQLADLGKWRAKAIAPHWTGRTADFIRVINTQGKGGITAQIKAFNPTKGDAHTWNPTGKANRRIANFNLVRWMHTSPRARSWIKSGDEKFMFTTRDYLNKIKKNVATGRFRNINLR